MQGYESLLSIFLDIFLKKCSKTHLKASNISEDIQKLLHLDILCTNKRRSGSKYSLEIQ